jgi:hypothetical protein
MQEYDVALKLLLQGPAHVTMRQVIGVTVEKWLDVELPKVENPRVDLLGETAGGGLVHLELQSSNEATMPRRMAEYCLRIFRLFGRFPRQVLVYVGEAPLRMDSELRGPDVRFRYRTIDVRSLDGDLLLDSDDVGDNVIAILTRLQDHREAVRRIVGRIAGLAAADRGAALTQLLILAGLRHLGAVVQEEVRKMPIDYNIREHEVLGPEFKKAIEEGRVEGRAEGRVEGERTLVGRMIEKRFGTLPRWAEERLFSQSPAELEELGIRLLDAQSLEDLLKPKPGETPPNGAN